MQIPARSPFDVRTQVSHIHIDEGTTPTIVVMAVNGAGQLVMVLPIRTETNATALQFPQGPILHLETPLSALQRLLLQECGLQSLEIELDSVYPVYRQKGVTEQGKTKDYHFVFVRIRKGRHPRFTDEVRQRTKAMTFVQGPAHLWEKMKDCGLSKQRLMITAVKIAIEVELLPKSIWGNESIEPAMRYAGQRN